VRPKLKADTVLALQTLAFRYEWETFYETILSDPALFADSLRRYRSGEELAFEDLSPTLGRLEASLASYLRSPLADALIRDQSLDIYLSSVESTKSSASWTLEALRQIGRLRKEIRTAMDSSPSPSDNRRIAAMTRDMVVDMRRASSDAVQDGNIGLFSRIRDTETAAGSLSDLTSESVSEEISRDRLTTLQGTLDRVADELRYVRDSSEF
jgi:hypothetical protein